MPGWESLPDEVKKHIMSFTLLAPFQGGHVPSVGQLAITSRVSKDFQKFSKAAAFDFNAIVALRSPPDQIVLSLATRLLSGELDEQTCANYLYRLSFTREMFKLRGDLQSLSTDLESGQHKVADIKEFLLRLLQSCLGKAMSDSEHLVDDLDGEGLRSLALRISRLYPKDDYLFVALGASADPVAVALAMLEHTVVYLPISGIEKRHKQDGGMETRVKNQMLKWPKHKFTKILLMDAMASGTALDVMRYLVSSISKSMDWKCEVVALSLNQLETGREDAAKLVRKERVAILEKDEGVSAFNLAQSRISGQEYKTGGLGRLFAKNVANASIDNAALKRMVATLLSNRL